MSLSLSIVALVFSLFSLVLVIWAFIELMAMKKSTHQVQMVPIEQVRYDEEGFEVLDEEKRKKIIESMQ